MYNVENKTSLTCVYNDEQFTQAFAQMTEDSATAYLSPIPEAETIRLIKSIVPMLEAEEKPLFYGEWEEFDFCGIYDLFFFERYTGKRYIIVAFKTDSKTLTYCDYEITDKGLEEWAEKNRDRFVMMGN